MYEPVCEMLVRGERWAVFYDHSAGEFCATSDGQIPDHGDGTCMSGYGDDLGALLRDIAIPKEDDATIPRWWDAADVVPDQWRSWDRPARGNLR